MHYYQFNIKDYKSHTDHLSLIEDLAYRRMIDWCYLHEKPLPEQVEEIAKRILMRTHSDSIANVLSEFFNLSPEGWENKTVLENIGAFQAKAEKCSKSAKVRWNKVKKDTDIMRTHSEGNANAVSENKKGNANNKPLTTNHKPLTTNQLKDLSAKADDTEASHDIFDFWKATMNKTSSTKFTTQRQQKIKARLKSGYTQQQIKTAILNCAKNPFNMGQNENGKVYDDLTLICRDDTKLELYMNDVSVSNSSSSNNYMDTHNQNINDFLDDE